MFTRRECLSLMARTTATMTNKQARKISRQAGKEEQQRLNGKKEENSQSTTKVFEVSQIRKSKGKRFKLAICEIAITILTVDSRKTRGERQSFCFGVS
jgi:hypothetical protein